MSNSHRRNYVTCRLTKPLALATVSLVALAAGASYRALAEDILRGHGGPVRALAVREGELISGSFDSSVIVWDLQRSNAKRVLRFHDGAVNAVALLPGDCFASGGDDGRIAIWCGASVKPARVLEGHAAKITALAVLDSGKAIASGSFDRTVRRWDLVADGASRTLADLPAPVSALASAHDGRHLLVGDMEGNLRHYDEGGQATSAVPGLALGAPVTGLAIAEDGEVVVAAADGHLRLVRDAKVAADIEIDRIPLASLALSPDGRLIATAGLRGGVSIIERQSRRVIHRLTGPGLPVWSLAFTADSRTLVSGGADRVIRRWDAIEGKGLTSTLPERDVVAEAAASGERGAVVFRACQACHTLSPEDGNRAGPTLHGVFGRKIGTAESYRYSPALLQLNIVWSKETIARLFEIGPAAYTPGTKMPEQTISDPADRDALVEWLARVTASR